MVNERGKKQSQMANSLKPKTASAKRPQSNEFKLFARRVVCVFVQNERTDIIITVILGYLHRESVAQRLPDRDRERIQHKHKHHDLVYTYP